MSVNADFKNMAVTHVPRLTSQGTVWDRVRWHQLQCWHTYYFDDTTGEWVERWTMVTDRQRAETQLRCSLDRLAYLYSLGSEASTTDLCVAWEAHVTACRALSRISDGACR